MQNKNFNRQTCKFRKGGLFKSPFSNGIEVAYIVEIPFFGGISMSLEFISWKSPQKEECEDAYIINEDRKIYGVMDGSTPLSSFKDETGHNGAFLAANLFKNYFEKLDGTEKSSLVQDVIHCNELLHQKMEESQIDIEMKHHLWSTCVALVEMTGDRVEFAQLGDCMIIAGYKDGSTRVLTKDTVKDINRRAREKRNKDRQNGVNIPEESFFGNIQNALLYNRTMANTPEGYSVANGMPEVKNHIQTGTIDRTQLAYLLLTTDGLFWPGKSYEYILEKVIEIGLTKYVEELTQELLAKKLKIDDRTAILISFAKVNAEY
jgi:serine/threonine protein phosphatase PrpC